MLHSNFSNLSIKSTLPIFVLLVSFFFFSFYSESRKCTFEEFIPRSNGTAAMGLGDRTGGPLSGGATCMGCHGGGATLPNLIIDLKDGFGSSISSYIPGDVYTIDFEVIGGTFFGFQGVALTNNNWQGGTLTNVLTPNTQITNLISTSGGLQYAEQQGISSSGIFSIQWTAPTAGTGPITFYGIGLSVNGNGSTSGDLSSLPTSLVINESISTSIGYAQSTYCQNDNNPVPTVSGATGGTFSSSAGLAIDPTSGIVDLSNSIAGNYVITYSFSGGSASFNLTIEAFLDASFSYSSASFCNTDGIVLPNVTHPGGNFSSFPAGLDLSSSSGEINTSTSSFGQYSVTHIMPGTCPDTSTQPITINGIDNGIVQSGTLLSSNENGAIYQWLDCDDNFMAIVGETGQTFTATENGNYAVEITNNGCLDTSACVNVMGIGILENSFGENFKIFPNPTNGNLNIDLGATYSSIALELFSLDGKLIDRQNFVNASEFNWIFNSPPGYYFLMVRSAEKLARIKLLKL